METPVTDTTKLREMLDFLDGSAPYKNRWYGQASMGVLAPYWWRSELRELAAPVLAKSDRADALEAGIRELVAKWRADDWSSPSSSCAEELAALLPADGEG